MSMNNTQSFNCNDVCIRRANCGDVERLAEICQVSFPDSLRWQGSSFYAKKWWRSTLKLNSCEVWVPQLNGQPAGFSMIIKDIKQYKKRKCKLSRNPLFAILAFVTCPKLFITQIPPKISKVIHQNGSNKHAGGVGKSAWLELIAVPPNMQHKGLATKMLDFCIERTKQFGRAAIGLTVEEENKNAIGLYEKSGFVETGQSCGSLVYEKIVNESSIAKTVDSERVIIARSLEEIERIRPEWEQMQSEEEYPIINADIDRYLSIIEAKGGDVEPYIVLMKRNGRPEAMFIGSIEDCRLKIKFGYKTIARASLRCLTIEYGGALGKKNSDTCVRAVSELMSTFGDNKVDVIFFNHLKTDSSLYHCARKMPSFICRGHLPKREPHWVMDIPKSMDDFYQARTHGHRHNLRRYIRKLEKQYPGQVNMITYCREDQLDKAIKAASDISAKTYQHALGSGFTDNPQVRSMLKMGARQNWLEFSVLSVEGRPCAFQYRSHYGANYFLEQRGFDPKWKSFGVGSVLFLKILENICSDAESGVLDFGFGDAEHKRSYGTRCWEEVSVYIFAPRFRPVAFNLVGSISRGASLGCTAVLNKMGVLSYIKRRWRNLMQGGDKN